MTDEEKTALVDRVVRHVYVVACEECDSAIDDWNSDWESEAEEYATEHLRADGRVLCDFCHNQTATLSGD